MRRLRHFYYDHERPLLIVFLFLIVGGLVLGFTLHPLKPAIEDGAVVRDCNTTALDPMYGPVLTGDGC